jgi:hypothetical protein
MATPQAWPTPTRNAGDLLTLNDNMSGGTNDLHYSVTYTNAHELQTESITDPDYVWQPPSSSTTTYAAANNLNQYPSVDGTSFTYGPKGNLIGDGAWVRLALRWRSLAGMTGSHAPRIAC